MGQHIKKTLLLGLSHLVLAGVTSAAAETDYEFKVPEHAGELLEFYCYDCHDAGLKKGGIRFDNLEELSQGQRLDLMNNALEQVYSGEMPPKKGDQPDDEERQKLMEWIWGELKIFNASKLEDKLRYYKYANYLNHEKLFDGKIEAKPFTPSRRWRVNELIYNERVNDVFELTGRERQDSFFGVVNPFNVSQEAGVRYYDTEVIEGGQFLTLLSNAKWIVDKQLRDALLKSGEFVWSPEYLEAKKKGYRKVFARFPDEAWLSGRTAAQFEAIILQDEVPSDELLENAITHQFKVALQRVPTPEEIEKYMGFTKETLAKSDKTSALKKMMVSVLMEPEFLYRNEFGGGAEDEHGRMVLKPREGAYAIAYALTDRIPDDKLFKAAADGNLESREDYEREVRRYLGDDSIEKPRILRFFREYFGYDNIFNVFKDEERFGGSYNPHRVIATSYNFRVPGKIQGEADTLVEWILEKDQNVLKKLLTTDRFFVHHNGDNAGMAKKAEKATLEYDVIWREVYNRTKGMKDNGRISEEILKIHEEHPEWGVDKMFLKKGGKIDGFYFKRSMDNLEVIFAHDPKGSENRSKVYMPGDPMPGHQVADPLTVSMYNLDHFKWSYQVEQPMKVENRIGMLTHPAWLVANSKNAATDPIHRGKWIREKLLGGFMRDVPITVDAKVPDDPHSTLREKFAVSEAKKCWQCHEKVNPLGYVLESYDDFGRFRIKEAIEYPENITGYRKIQKSDFNRYKEFEMPVYKTKPVDTSGYLEGTGDESLDGPVNDVNDLMTRLAKSDKVRQVFIRNVFRYFMGRNETLDDSQTLINADKAYLRSGGSFKELMVSILTSDSFIYRKRTN